MEGRVSPPRSPPLRARSPLHSWGKRLRSRARGALVPTNRLPSGVSSPPAHPEAKCQIRRPWSRVQVEEAGVSPLCRGWSRLVLHGVARGRSEIREDLRPVRRRLSSPGVFFPGTHVSGSGNPSFSGGSDGSHDVSVGERTRPRGDARLRPRSGWFLTAVRAPLATTTAAGALLRRRPQRRH